MTTLRTYVLTALALAALLLSFATSGVGHAAISAVQTVFVVNTASNPVAVAPQDSAPTAPFQTQLIISGGRSGIARV